MMWPETLATDSDVNGVLCNLLRDSSPPQGLVYDHAVIKAVLKSRRKDGLLFYLCVRLFRVTDTPWASNTMLANVCAVMRFLRSNQERLACLRAMRSCSKRAQPGPRSPADTPLVKTLRLRRFNRMAQGSNVLVEPLAWSVVAFL